MKKYRLFLPLVALLMIGCGDGSSSKKPADTTPEPLAVYDFSEFIVPPVEIYYVYDTITYEKVEGNYTEVDDDSFYRKYRYDDNSTITILDDSIEQKKTIIGTNDIIIENLLLEEEKVILERNISVGDVVFSSIINETRDGFSGETVTDCIISNHLEEKIIDDKNFMNILEQTCVSIFKATGSGESTREDVLTVITYFAKDNAEISSTNESCTLVKYGEEVLEDNCTKVESTLDLVIP